jgi:hypothetical protein
MAFGCCASPGQHSADEMIQDHRMVIMHLAFELQNMKPLGLFRVIAATHFRRRHLAKAEVEDMREGEGRLMSRAGSVRV